MHTIHIPGKKISPTGPVFIIAEAGVNHNGDLGLAKQLIDAAKEAGVDAVKFQLFHADKLVTRKARQAAYQRKNIGVEESQYEMLKRLELPDEAFVALKAYAEARGLIFMATPFDHTAIDFLYELGVPLFKVGSGDLTNLPFLHHMASKGLPLIVSTGMARIEEVQAAQQVIEATGNTQVVFLHCTSNYPCPMEEVNLRAMDTLRAETNCLVGYSDHTEGILVPVAATSRGAVVIEKHYTLDRNLPGPDHKASLEPSELTEMVTQIRRVETVLGSPHKQPADSEIEVAKVARKSLVVLEDLLEGAVLEWAMLSAKRPGTGISPAEVERVIGKRLRQAVPADTVLTWDMLA